MTANAVLRRALALVTVAALLAACTGGGGKDDDADQDVLPLPASAPPTAGPARGPEMVPKVLLASADDLDESLGGVDTAQVDRRSGAFVSASTVVGYSVDNISGYDLASGKQLWTAKLDLGGGTVCLVSQPDRPVKTFTVAYGKAGYCGQIATLRVSDGKVLKKVDTADSLLSEDSMGPVEQLFTLKGVDYLVDFNGVVYRMSKGAPKKVAQLEQRSYFKLYVSPEAPLLLAVPLGGEDPGVEAYSLPSFDLAWKQDEKTLFPKSDGDSVISLVRGNGLWATSKIGVVNYMVQLDPKDGSVIGSDEDPENSKITEGTFDVSYGALQAETTLGLPDGDVVFPQVGGMMRYSLARKEVVWSLSLKQLELDSDDEFALTTTAPLALTSDKRHVIAAISNTTAVEIVAINTKTGKLDARWPVPKEYRNGFQVEPTLTLFDQGVVLNRNFDQWDFEFASYKDRKPPSGDRYDIGVFTFPEADDSAPSKVPVEGPPNAEAKAIGTGIPADLPEPGVVPDGTAGQVVHFRNGGHIIAVTQSDIVSVDATTGKKDWSGQLASQDVEICDTSKPDRAATSFLVAYRTPDSKGVCNGLVQIAASDGKVARVDLSASSKGVNRIISFDGADFVATRDATVSRIEKGALVKQGDLARPIYYAARTPQQTSLLITSGQTSAKRWVVDAYEMPSFTKVWSRTDQEVFDATVPSAGGMLPWTGNGLWMSAGFGGSDTVPPTKTAVVQLDPRDGSVIASTGQVKNTLDDPDLERFDPGDAALGAYSSEVGFDNGDVVVEQDTGIMRYSLQRKEIVWATDIDSIVSSMAGSSNSFGVSRPMTLVDGGKQVQVTLSNNSSVEVMTLDAKSGKIRGRWLLPTKRLNGLQTGPDVIGFTGGVALAHDRYGWQNAQPDTSTATAGPGYDLGLFRYAKPKKKG